MKSPRRLLVGGGLAFATLVATSLPAQVAHADPGGAALFVAQQDAAALEAYALGGPPGIACSVPVFGGHDVTPYENVVLGNVNQTDAMFATDTCTSLGNGNFTVVVSVTDMYNDAAGDLVPVPGCNELIGRGDSIEGVGVGHIEGLCSVSAPNASIGAWRSTRMGETVYYPGGYYSYPYIYSPLYGGPA